MKISEVLPKESISEVYFRYPFKMEGYPNLSSDIPKLYEINQLGGYYVWKIVL